MDLHALPASVVEQEQREVASAVVGIVGFKLHQPLNEIRIVEISVEPYREVICHCAAQSVERSQLLDYNFHKVGVETT